MKIHVGIVDDHQLFRKSLILLLNSLPEMNVVVDANNGRDLQGKMKVLEPLPDIILIDVTMPVMDGVETATWLHTAFPDIRLVALSMNDQESMILRMMRAGCCSYLLKDMPPEMLRQALQEVYAHRYFNADLPQRSLSEILREHKEGTLLRITEKEREFLQLATSDHTYKQIAALMHVSERTIDGYRESLFAKLQVQSRTGMVLEGIKRGLVKF
jgi:DNA-binding NarL/FixJ family response regulator